MTRLRESSSPLLLTHLQLGRSSGSSAHEEHTLCTAVQFLATCQSEDGHFPTEVSVAPTMSNSYEERSVYVHSYVLQALSNAFRSLPLLEQIIQGATANLRSLQGDSGWWKFYGPYSDEPPDDVDDTAVAFAGLLSATGLADIRLVDETNGWLLSLARIRSESGLYKTWADAAWNGECFELPDVVVNANVFLLQSIVGRPDPQVAEYLARVVRTETYHVLNLFAVSLYAVPFLISRSHFYGTMLPVQGSASRLAGYVLCRQDSNGGWGGDLDTVLALLTLLNAGYTGPEISRAVACLLERQQADGGWASGPLFRDLSPRYYGARSLTTAHCLEALSRLTTANA
jgi:Prenyltransferase and squalene oxidase repeat